MTSLAARERALLCALARQVGPDASTLCDGWDVRRLLAHLLVREGSPASVGIVVPALSGLADRAMARWDEADFASMVRLLQHGPPLLSPFSLPKVDAAANSVEFFVHHEDIRRAQDGWTARTLPRKVEDSLWRSLRIAARKPLSASPVGVTARRVDTGETRSLRRGDRTVEVVGLPSEILLFVLGRTRQALVDLHGDDADVAGLTGADLGL